MKPSRLEVRPLTDEAFAPFGDVVQKHGHQPQEINYGRTLKYASLADIDVGEGGGEPAVHIYHSQPIDLPFRVEIMECHPLGSQAFIPLHNRPFLVVVAPPGEEPMLGSIRGFITNGEQGVNIHKGVWHHYQLSLGEPADYLVIERGGPGENCVERQLKDPLIIENLELKNS